MGHLGRKLVDEGNRKDDDRTPEAQRHYLAYAVTQITADAAGGGMAVQLVTKARGPGAG